MNKLNTLPTKDYLEQCFNYDPETGLLYWKNRPLEHFKDERIQKSWNSRFANTEAFTTINPKGYKTGRLNNQTWLAHRVIYKLIHGIDADNIDHDNRNPSDNRINNLINAGQSKNCKNKSKAKNNTSGVSGVSWDKTRNMWLVTITLDSIKRYVGRYKTIEEATEVRKLKELELNYHPNHCRENPY